MFKQTKWFQGGSSIEKIVKNIQKQWQQARESGLGNYLDTRDGTEISHKLVEI